MVVLGSLELDFDKEDDFIIERPFKFRDFKSHPQYKESQKYFDSEDESDSAKSIEDEAAIEKESSIDSSELSSDLDDLLDEIDQVLESNAEEFVKSYVQKGGQ